jgi:cobalt/nickel transport protein
VKTATKCWIGLAILAVISPLGLILPEHFKAGAAWGEWGLDEMRKLVGYVPQGFERLSSIWRAPMADYVFRGWEGNSLGKLSIAYVVSAMLGIAITVAVMLLLGKLLTKRR